MSAASWALTPRSGIAVIGLTCCVWRNQRTMFSGVFGSAPAIFARRPIVSSEGPTCTALPERPGMRWQERQA